MYQEHFNLTDLPFENTPNPAFFYGGGQYRECLSAMLHYVANRRGIMGLSGPIGVGKTTLVHTLRRVLPENTKVLSLIHPESSPLELLTYVAQGLDLDSMPESRLQAVEVVKNELIRLDQVGGVCLLIVDESQLLTPDLLEQLRLLSNLETETHKLIQVILVGQPELVTILNQPELAAVRQRVSLMKVLSALNPEESLYYIGHRLSRAGAGMDLFSDQALKTVVGYAGGIPRIINQLCEGALVSAFGAERDVIEIVDVEEAAANLLLVGARMVLSSPSEMPPEPLDNSQSPIPPGPEPNVAATKNREPLEPAHAGEPDRAMAPAPGPDPDLAPGLEQRSDQSPFSDNPGTSTDKRPPQDQDLSEPIPAVGGGLPQEMVFEAGPKAVPPEPGRTLGRLAAPILGAQNPEPLEPTPPPEPVEMEEEPEKDPGDLSWSPPPPVPAPEEPDQRFSILKPIVILAACLLLLSAAVGFYLSWNRAPAENNKQSTITIPLKPGSDKAKGD